jgi:diguanylate cyclase (GGDEF)-like protein
MLPDYSAPLANAVAFSLALAFRRNRAALAFMVLLPLALAVLSEDERLLAGARGFGPWLLLAAAALPEPRLWSRRSAAFVCAWLALLGLTLHAPAHVLRGLVWVAQLPYFGRDPAHAAAIWTLLGAALCLARWVLRGAPIELGLSLALTLGGIALGAGYDPNAARAWLAAAGTLGALAVLYASYRMAFVDALTGLPNRRALDETLAQLDRRFGLAMVDIDHFKRFNDTYGHAAGDIVLASVARELKRSSGSRAYRFGGEEFCLLFDGSDDAVALAGCDRAREAVAARRIVVPLVGRVRGEPVRREPVSVTISVGYAACEDRLRSAREVLKAADQALYVAKNKGRNRVVRA